MASSPIESEKRAVATYVARRRRALRSGVRYGDVDRVLLRDWCEECPHFLGWDFARWRRAVVDELGSDAKRAVHEAAPRRRRKASTAEIILKRRVARAVGGAS